MWKDNEERTSSLETQATHITQLLEARKQKDKHVKH